MLLNVVFKNYVLLLPLFDLARRASGQIIDGTSHALHLPETRCGAAVLQNGLIVAGQVVSVNVSRQILDFRRQVLILQLALFQAFSLVLLVSFVVLLLLHHFFVPLKHVSDSRLFFEHQVNYAAALSQVLLACVQHLF